MKRLFAALGFLALSCLTTGALGLAATTVLGQLGRWQPSFDAFNHFAPIWFVGAAAMAGVSAIAVRGLERATLLTLSLIALVASGQRLAPELYRAAMVRPVAGPASFRLVQANVWLINRDPAATAKWILDQNPDAITLEEGEFRGAEVIALLADRYPYRSCAWPGNCVTAVLSRHKPSATGGLGGINGAWMRIPDPKGDIVVAAFHNTWPLPAREQQWMIRRVSGALNALPKDRLILGGDFNTTPWSFAMDRQDRTFAGLARHSFALWSWPAHAVSRLRVIPGVAVMPIDHVYAGPRWGLVSIKTSPALGSDHHLVVADFAAR